MLAALSFVKVITPTAMLSLNSRHIKFQILKVDKEPPRAYIILPEPSNAEELLVKSGVDVEMFKVSGFSVI